jgi:hypothetical protein
MGLFLLLMLGIVPHLYGYSENDVVPGMVQLSDVQVTPKALNIYDEPNGKKRSVLPAGESIRILDVSGEWAQIEAQKWMRRKDLPALLLLAHDFIPELGGRPLFSFSSPSSSTRLVQCKDKVLLMISDLEMEDGRSPLHYWVFSTDIPAFPFMLLYSGHSGDMHQDNPAMVLFGGNDIRTWQPNPGNRVNTDYVGISGDRLIIREAVFCTFSVKTALEIKADGIKRSGSVFDKDQCWSHVPESTSDDFNRLTKDVRLYKNRGKGHYTLLKSGTAVSIKFKEADSDNQLLRVEINGTAGWVCIQDLLDSCPMVRSYACCGCG